MSRWANLNNGMIFAIIIECLLQYNLKSVTVTALVLIPYFGSAHCVGNNRVEMGSEEVVKAVL